MHDRNWVSYIAFGIIIGLGLSLVLLNYVHLRHGYFNHGYQHTDQNDQDEDNPNRINDWVFGPDGHSDRDCPLNPDDTNYYQCRDLKAQQSMAFSTAEIEGWTRISVVLAAIGAAAIVWTLRATISTVGQAAKSNELSRKALIAENRPWIAIDDIKLMDVTLDGSTLEATIAFKANNVGKGVGRDVHFDVRGVCGGGDDHAALGNFAREHRLSYQHNSHFGTIIFPTDNPDIPRSFSVKWENLTSTAVNGLCGRRWAPSPRFAVSICYKPTFAGDVFQTAKIYSMSQVRDGRAGAIDLSEFDKKSLGIGESDIAGVAN